MGKTNYDRLLEAKQVLGVGEKATMNEIKASYRKLLHQYHPDKARQPVEKCELMTRRITEAYAVIQDYCSSYSYSFKEEDMKLYQTEEEWWYNKFGKDPVWQGD